MPALALKPRRPEFPDGDFANHRRNVLTAQLVDFNSVGEFRRFTLGCEPTFPCLFVVWLAVADSVKRRSAFGLVALNRGHRSRCRLATVGDQIRQKVRTGVQNATADLDVRRAAA